MTHVELCEICGKHVPLSSVKVVWLCSGEEKARGRNCGFLAYINPTAIGLIFDRLTATVLGGLSLSICTYIEYGY